MAHVLVCSLETTCLLLCSPASCWTCWPTSANNSYRSLRALHDRFYSYVDVFTKCRSLIRVHSSLSSSRRVNSPAAVRPYREAARAMSLFLSSRSLFASTTFNGINGVSTFLITSNKILVFTFQWPVFYFSTIVNST